MLKVTSGVETGSSAMTDDQDDIEYFNRSSKILEEAMEMEKEQMKRICFRSLEAHFDELYYENFKIKWK